jgi:hypothetical protein
MTAIIFSSWISESRRRIPSPHPAIESKSKKGRGLRLSLSDLLVMSDSHENCMARFHVIANQQDEAIVGLRQYSIGQVEFFSAVLSSTRTERHTEKTARRQSFAISEVGETRARGRSLAVVRVGSGDLAACIAMDRADQTIANHGRGRRGLRITWAKLEPLFAGDVEVYLAQQLRPLVGHQFPLSPAIEINLPMLG